MILAKIKENCSNTVCRGWVKCVFYLRQTLSVTALIKFVMFSAWTWSFSLRSSVLLNNRFSVLIIRSSSACVWFRESLLQSIVIFYPLFLCEKKNGPSPPLAQRRTWNKDFEIMFSEVSDLRLFRLWKNICNSRNFSPRLRLEKVAYCLM